MNERKKIVPFSISEGVELQVFKREMKKTVGKGGIQKNHSGGIDLHGCVLKIVDRHDNRSLNSSR